MNIAIGADHRGYEHKELIKKEIKKIFEDVQWVDVGAYNLERSDYPVFARKVCETIRYGDATMGILICGSGIGMAVAANRYPKIYAGLVWNKEIAQISKEHDNTNVLVIPSDFVLSQEVVELVKNWLQSIFKGGRYQDRIDMIDAIKPMN